MQQHMNVSPLTLLGHVQDLDFVIKHVLPEVEQVVPARRRRTTQKGCGCSAAGAVRQGRSTGKRLVGCRRCRASPTLLRVLLLNAHSHVGLALHRKHRCFERRRRAPVGVNMVL